MSGAPTMSAQAWDYISSPKTLTGDNSHYNWELHQGPLNSYLTHLPWHVLDSPLNRDCLMYNIDSRGALHLLGIFHVVRIRTRPHSMTLVYKYDSKHARLHVFRIPQERWAMTGLMTISTSVSNMS